MSGCSERPGRFFRDVFTTLVLRSVVQTVYSKVPCPSLDPPVMTVMWTVHPLGCGCFFCKGGIGSMRSKGREKLVGLSLGSATYKLCELWTNY